MKHVLINVDKSSIHTGWRQTEFVTLKRLISQSSVFILFFKTLPLLFVIRSNT